MYLFAIPYLLHRKHCSKETGTKTGQDKSCKASSYVPLEAAARFHHRVVQIHPFPNGNGRHARIAADVLLGDYYDQGCSRKVCDLAQIL
ncbi:Fic family protein [Pacificibacter sp. AS14]|uniref:Fic family protein n=1 Tax=Pacificibacter sp. AS14 TaxID=3135785 RepID=UPI00317B237A